MNRRFERIGLGRSENGGALMELAIVIPLLCLLAFGALSLSGGLSEAQLAGALSRELATAAFRECLADPDAVGSQTLDPGDCFETVLNDPTRFSSAAAPGARVVVSLYNWVGGAAKLTAMRASPGTLSKFSTASFGGPDPAGIALASALQGYQRLVIAEVYVPATMEQILPGLYRFNTNGTVYASTVI